MRRLVVAFFLLLVVPNVHAQGSVDRVLYCSKDCRPSDVNDPDVNNTPVNVILYAHIQDALQRAPLNTLPPDPAQEKDVNGGFPTPTIRLREDVVNFENNWFYLYHLPKFVEYGTSAANQDGPLSYPLELVGKTIKLYWYLSPHAVPSQNSSSLPARSLGAMPNVNVYARIDTGRHPFHGSLVAEGRTSTPIMVSLPGEDYAYQFEVPLEIKNATVPPDGGFVVSINWYQFQNGENQAMQSDWRVRTGIRFAPRLVMPVGNPMKLLETESLFRAGTHYLATGLSPVFGAYDIDPYSLNMTYESGPSKVGNPAPLFYFYNPIRPQVVKVVWAVPSDGPPLSAGNYTFRLAAMNLQHTYRFQSDVPLSIIAFNKARPQSIVGLDAAPPALLWTVSLGLVGCLGLTGVVAWRRHN
jgi:hypothetical protein